MKRKPSYYLKKSFVAMLGAVAGLVVGLQIETNHAAMRSNADTYFAMQAYASDVFVLSATPSPFVACTGDCVDSDRECGTGVETDCIYL